MIKIIFYLGSFIIIYHYILYPIIICIVSNKLKRGANVSIENYLPSVTFVIAAYNEEKYIEKKLASIKNQDYPIEKVQTIIISDGSTDKTAHLISSHDLANMIYINEDTRHGKANALNLAYPLIENQIVIYSDANVLFSRDMLKNIIISFKEKNCGAVTGCVELASESDEEPLGEGAYMRYEKILQICESNVGTTITVDGGLFAIRKEFVKKIPINTILDDLYIAKNVLEKGYKIKYSASAKAIEYVHASVANEFKRKIRISAGAYQLLQHIKFYKLLKNNTLAFFELFSHKILRWFSWLALIMVFVSCVLLKDNIIYLVLLIVQSGFYGLAVVGHLVKKLRKNMIVYIPYYFSAINLAMFIGFFRNFSNQQNVKWESSDR